MNLILMRREEEILYGVPTRSVVTLERIGRQMRVSYDPTQYHTVPSSTIQCHTVSSRKAAASSSLYSVLCLTCAFGAGSEVSCKAL